MSKFLFQKKKKTNMPIKNTCFWISFIKKNRIEKKMILIVSPKEYIEPNQKGNETRAKPEKNYNFSSYLIHKY